MRSFIAACTLAALGFAAVLPAEAQPGRRRFTRLDDDLLAQKRINAFLQDRRGFLWIATGEGLARFDGYGAILYRPSADPGSISSSNVQALYEDEEGRLWIGTFDGIDRFEAESETFVRVLRSPGGTSFGTVSPSTLTGGAEGLWVGTWGEGLSLLDPVRGTTITYRHDPEDPRSLAGDRIHTLLRQADGRLWIGHDAGLDLYDPVSGTFSNRPLAAVESLASGADGILWIGTRDGLYRLDTASGEATTFRHDPNNLTSLTHGYIRALYEDPADRLWIGTGDGGLDILPTRSWKTPSFEHHRYHVADPASLSSDNVLALFQDRGGLVWIGSANGVNLFNPHAEAFVNYRPDASRPEAGLSGPEVRSVFEDRAGTLWVGTTQGLNAVSPDRREIRHYRHHPTDPNSLSHDHVSAILEDRQGELWVGTPFTGLSRLERASARFTHYQHDPADPSSLSSNDILTLAEDSAGRMWIGTWDAGLNLFDREASRFTRFRHDPEEAGSLANDSVFVVHEDGAGNLWLGTCGPGLERFDPLSGKVERYPFASGDSEDCVTSIYSDAVGLWAGRWHSGLLQFDPATGSYRRVENLPGENIIGLLGDEAGGIWMSTETGIARLDPVTGEVRAYAVADGLQGNIFNIHSASKSPKSGELFFGGRNGLTAFFPASIRDHRTPPPLALTAVEIPGRELSAYAVEARGELELRPHDLVLTLSFAALDFESPRRNRYAYRLDGEPWTDLGRERRITFSRLEPGEHALQVRGGNRIGVWSEKNLSLRITVIPPWWRSRPFYGGCTLLLLTLGFAGYRRRRRAIDALEQEVAERRRNAEERERMIAQLESKNADLERFSYAVSHDLRNPLFTIQGFLGHLEKDVANNDRERVAEDLLRIRTAVRTMGLLLEDVLKLSRLGHAVHTVEQIDLQELVHEVMDLMSGRLLDHGAEVVIMPNLPRVSGDRVRLLQIFLNLIDNAVKFCGDQEMPRIEIGVRTDSGEPVLYVADNGIGIEPMYHERVFGLFNSLDPDGGGTGIGLALVKRIVELHGGRVWIESEGLGHGTTFCFTLP